MDEKYSIGNTVHTTVVTLFGGRYNYTYHSKHCIMYINIQPLCCTSELKLMEYCMSITLQSKNNNKYNCLKQCPLLVRKRNIFILQTFNKYLSGA